MRYCFHCMGKMDSDAARCPHCGAGGTYTPLPHHLPPGAMLRDQYLIGEAIGQGGFGITYIGLDSVLDARVAIKEYYPNGYASRNTEFSPEVTITDTRRLSMIGNGKKKFLEEARILAAFRRNPGVVDVLNFFEENNTAYIIMDYLEGRDLRSCLKERRFSADEIFRMMRPILETLQKIHEKNVIHRDISPDNIMLLDDGSLKLMDFGAARFVDPGDPKSLSIVLKAGYAPEEQYRERGVQGPWTDVYAICATMYKCITGITPDDALQRGYQDETRWPSELGCPITEGQEAILKQGMAFRQKDRIQSIGELLEAMDRERSDGSPEIHIETSEPFSRETLDLEDGAGTEWSPESETAAVLEEDNPGGGLDSSPGGGSGVDSVTEQYSRIRDEKTVFDAEITQQEEDSGDPPGRRETPAVPPAAPVSARKKTNPAVLGLAAGLVIAVIGAAAFFLAGRAPGPQESAAVPGEAAMPEEAHNFVIEDGELIEYNGPGGDVSVPDGVLRIGERAFSGCAGLTRVSFPDSVVRIGDYAFAGCTGLQSAVIPNSVARINDGAFSGCSSLDSITLPEKITRIWPDTFSGCSALKRAAVPEGVTRIDSGAFSGCSSLAAVTIPDSLAGIGKDAFAGTPWMEEKTGDFVMIGTLLATYRGTDAVVQIPDSVTGIGDGAFDHNETITSVILPETVANIGAGAFSGCTSLSGVSISGSLAGVGKDAFAGTPWMEEQTGDFVMIGDVLALYRGELSEITIPDGVSAVGEWAFSGCSGLTGVSIPDGVEEIGQWAFARCENLASVTVPGSAANLDDCAFYGCTALTSAIISEGVQRIGSWTFCGCTALTSVTIPDSVSRIDEGAFSNCPALTGVTLPESVTWIGEYAFPGITLHGAPGSYAETWALAHGVAFAAE